MDRSGPIQPWFQKFIGSPLEGLSNQKSLCYIRLNISIACAVRRVGGVGFMIKRTAFLVTMAAFACLSTGSASAQDALTVFAAASLKNALDAVNAACEAEVGEGDYFLCRELGARQADRGRRAGRRVHVRRPRLDEVPFGQEAYQAGYRGEASRQSIVLVAPKDSKAETTIAPNFDLAGTRRRRQARHGQCRLGAGRQIWQGRIGKARRLGFGRGQGGAGGECARRAEAGVDRRGRARHRLSDRRQRPRRASRLSEPSRRIRTRRSSIRSA
jgi:hypothetical protein